MERSCVLRPGTLSGDLTRGPRRKPGAFSYTLTRFSLSVPTQRRRGVVRQLRMRAGVAPGEGGAPPDRRPPLQRLGRGGAYRETLPRA